MDTKPITQCVQSLADDYLWRGIFPSNRGHAGPPLSCREVIHRARHPIYRTLFRLSQQYVGFLLHILA